MDINLDVINQAYGWTISEEGELLALTSGDMGYQPTGIHLEGETLKIWKTGVDVCSPELPEN
jgi:hypothetical protein